MANIHHVEFKDTDSVEFTVTAAVQTADNIGLLKVAIKPEEPIQQFQGRIKLSGGDPFFDGEYDIYGNSAIVPFISKSTPTDITVNFDKGQNVLQMSGVILVDDED